MDPNSNPWSYTYNRIVPSSTSGGMTEEFQHPHLATISAAGQSAQSLLLQAAHTGIAASFNAAAVSGSGFVSPSPISTYNPVFQQIYHHAAAASVQPKPAHYASTAVNTPHRQLQIPSTVDKQLTAFQNHAAVSTVSSAVTPSTNNVASNYYGENSSSSGASPSPTTSAITSTSLSWNAPMISNTFLAMQQQQAQPNQTQLIADKVSRQQQERTVLTNVASSTLAGQQQQQQQTQQQQIQQQIDNDDYYTVDGKNYKIARKHPQQHQQQQQVLHVEQNVVSPVSAYPLYANSASGAGSNLHTVNTTPQVIVYKSNVSSIPTGNGSAVNSGGIEPSLRRNITSAGSLATSTVAYSSVIQRTLQQHPLHAQPHEQIASNSWPKANNNDANGDDVKNVLQLHVKQEHRQLNYVANTNIDGENLIFNLPPGLEIKQTIYQPAPNSAGVSVLQHTQQHQDHSELILQQIYNNNNNDNQKMQNQEKQRRQHMIANMLISPTTSLSAHQTQQNQLQQSLSHEHVTSSNASTTLPSQIQINPKVDQPAKPTKSAKTPRKRQPKKNLSSEYGAERSPQEATPQHHQQQHQQHHVTYYDFANPLATAQSQTVSTPPSQLHPQQQSSQQLPQPAHLQSSQAQSHPHLTNLSTYYPTLPSQIASPYTACMQQATGSNAIQHSLYNLNQQHSSHPQDNQTKETEPQQPQIQINVQQPSDGIVSTLQNNDISNKVIVPNIEEELEFLTDSVPKQGYATSTNGRSTNSANNNTNFGIRNPQTAPVANSNCNSSENNSSTNQPNQVRAAEKKTICVGTSIGEKKTQFMDSYLKFLQGERDESPPPVVKSGRKINYQKSTTNNGGTGGLPKRPKSNSSNDETTVTQSSELREQVVPSTATATSTNEDGHKIKILSQTLILPKKRLHAQMAAAAAAAATTTSSSPVTSSTSHLQHPGDAMQQSDQSFRPYQQDDNVPQQQMQSQQQQYRDNNSTQQTTTQLGLAQDLGGSSQDPLILPPRREQSLRKAKQMTLQAMHVNSTGNDDQFAEPPEFADSDTDPSWTPQEENGSDDGRNSSRRRGRRSKSLSRKNNPCTSQTQRTKASRAHHEDCIQLQDQPNNLGINTSVIFNSNQEYNNASTILYSNSTSADNFKTGDFIVLRSDLVNDWPIIWQVDSKCILQKYEPFCQNGKMFYRNMSKYASWNLETKKLYLKAPVRIQIQSHTETVVEFMRAELLADDTEQFIEKIMEDYLAFRDHFEIYMQTMISQVLDPSFFSEIAKEKDEYFLRSVRAIDSIMDKYKCKLLSITPWTRSIIVSIETWPKCHVFTEWGQNNLTHRNCGGCHQPGISVRFLLFGDPYNPATMQTVPSDSRISYEKDILLCRICAARADIFHKIAHEKYNLYVNCTLRVTDQQEKHPAMSSTEILNELLAEHNWVDELFHNMRSSWAEVESLERQNRLREVTQ